MYGYIYETTNTVNNKTYIGQHKSTQFDANYKGSGVLLTRAFDKYGRDNFTVKMLAEAETAEELDMLEQQFISNARINGKCEYNIAAGGQYTGGWYWMKKGNSHLQISKSEIERYLSEGWIFGRCEEIHNKGKNRNK